MHNKIGLPFAMRSRKFFDLSHTKVFQSRSAQIIYKSCINQSASEMTDHCPSIQLDDAKFCATHARLIQPLQKTDLGHAQTLDSERLAGEFLKPAERAIGSADQ